MNASHARSDDTGFTLVELLVVIVILGVLAGIAVFAVGNLTTNSVQAACKSDYKTVELAVESYKAQEGEYPTTGDHGLGSGDAVTAAKGLLAGDTSASPHLGPWLRDQPINAGHYRIEASTDGSGKVQVYKADGTMPIGGTGNITDCAGTS
jgi:general secretion pathway protein G